MSLIKMQVPLPETADELCAVGQGGWTDAGRGQRPDKRETQNRNSDFQDRIFEAGQRGYFEVAPNRGSIWP